MAWSIAPPCSRDVSSVCDPVIRVCGITLPPIFVMYFNLFKVLIMFLLFPWQRYRPHHLQSDTGCAWQVHSTEACSNLEDRASRGNKGRFKFTDIQNLPCQSHSKGGPLYLELWWWPRIERVGAEGAVSQTRSYICMMLSGSVCWKPDFDLLDRNCTETCIWVITFSPRQEIHYSFYSLFPVRLR